MTTSNGLGVNMPEGPEVKKMGFDMSKKISGKTIKSVTVLSGRYTKKPISGFEDISRSLPTKVVGVGVHGKFLYVITDSSVNLWSTLGMTGQWSSGETKHSRVKIQFTDAEPLYFNDQRNFGTLKFVYGPSMLKSKLTKMGPDMFSTDTTSEVFVERLRKKENWNITKALMNQAVLAGIGNYIKSEALWLAGISPLRSVSDIVDHDLELLFRAVKGVMLTSYEHGGATFLTHKNFSGESGDYSSRFLCYNRKIDAEGNKVIKTPTPDGRTTHWSPDKQK